MMFSTFCAFAEDGIENAVENEYKIQIYVSLSGSDKTGTEVSAILSEALNAQGKRCEKRINHKVLR